MRMQNFQFLYKILITAVGVGGVLPPPPPIFGQDTFVGQNDGKVQQGAVSFFQICTMGKKASNIP